MEKKVILPISVITVFFLYVFKSALSLDTDLGWHLRMGQEILQHGIPATDPLSYTMPSYPFVDHEWLSNISLFIIYAHAGMIVLAVVFSVTSIVSVLLQIPRKHIRWAAAPVVLVLMSMLPLMGIRTQTITWLLFSILLIYCENYERFHLLRFAVIPFILIWTNLHGGFPISLTVLFIFFAVRAYVNRRLYGVDWLIFMLSTGVTFLNPYGWRIWWEIWMQMADHGLRRNIIEWMPAVYFFDIFLWVYCILTAGFIYRYRRRYPLYEVIVCCGLFFAALSSYRHIPLWLIASVPMTVRGFCWFHEELKAYEFGQERFHKLYGLFCIGIGMYLVLHGVLYFNSSNIKAESTHFPRKAIPYIRSHMPDKNIYTIYEWGGYMEWKLPQKRVFIDGRMPSWRWKSPSPHESDYAFAEYLRLLKGEQTFRSLKEKYDIELVVVPVKKDRRPWPPAETLERFLTKTFHLEPAKPPNDPFSGMKKVYADEVTAVYRP